MESISIKNCESCQDRKVAAINRSFYVKELSTEELGYSIPFLKYNRFLLSLGGAFHMDYTSLYRKFRPQTFSEMIGQEHIVKTIKNEILAGRIGHAYLFSGGR